LQPLRGNNAVLRSSGPPVRIVALRAHAEVNAGSWAWLEAGRSGVLEPETISRLERDMRGPHGDADLGRSVLRPPVAAVPGARRLLGWVMTVLGLGLMAGGIAVISFL
jgi:hypothetical protein